MKRIAALAREIDVVKLVGILAELQPADLAHLASQVRAKHAARKPLPEAHGDFYELGQLLPPDELAVKLRVREAMAREVAPIVNDYWLRGEFPHQVVPTLAALDIAGLTFKGYGFPARSMCARRARRRGRLR